MKGKSGQILAFSEIQASFVSFVIRTYLFIEKSPHAIHFPSFLFIFQRIHILMVETHIPFTACSGQP